MFDRDFSGFVHCVSGGLLWASRGDCVWRSPDDGLTWQPVVRLPLAARSRLQGASRLSRRLFRMYVYHLRVVENRWLVVLGFGRHFTFDLQDGSRLVAQGPLKSRRPLGLCCTRDGRLLYGEYHGNPERRPVGIWESADCGRTWQQAHVFRGIRHVHGVYEDTHADAIWITTGDEDHESAIWRASRDLAVVEPVIAGGQQARAIRLEFTRDHIYYGSDTPFEPNHLYRLGRDDLRPCQIAAVDGSVFHSASVGEALFFTTACEPSPVNRARRASLYRVTGGDRCERVASWSKDLWPGKLFQYGQLLCAADQGLGSGLWITPFATRGDQRSRRLDPTAPALEICS